MKLLTIQKAIAKTNGTDCGRHSTISHDFTINNHHIRAIIAKNIANPTVESILVLPPYSIKLKQRGKGVEVDPSGEWDKRIGGRQRAEFKKLASFKSALQEIAANPDSTDWLRLANLEF